MQTALRNFLDSLVGILLSLTGGIFALLVFLLIGIGLLLRLKPAQVRRYYERPSEFKWRERAFKPNPEFDQVVTSKTTLLDVGAGNGFKAQEIARKYGALVTLCDIGDFNHTDLPLKVFDGKHLPFPDKSFDVVVFSFVLHHAEDPIQLLGEAKRVSRSDVVIYEDHNSGIVARVSTALHGFAFNWIYETSNRCQFHSQKDWERIFRDLGFTLKQSVTRWRTGSITYPVKECAFILGVDGDRAK